MSSSTPASAFDDAIASFFRAARRARGRANQGALGGQISLAQYHLVEPLLAEPQTVGRLAALAGVSAPTASRMLESLRARDLVRRTTDEQDRRSVRVELTADGRALAEDARGRIAAARRRMAAALSEEEQAAAADLLTRLADVIEEL